GLLQPRVGRAAATQASGAAGRPRGRARGAGRPRGGGGGGRRRPRAGGGALAAGVGGRPETAAAIGVRAGKIINHYKMAKHFSLTIRDGSLVWARKEDAIQKEELLDGIYVIRTSEPAKRLTAADGVRSYKRLGLVGQGVRWPQGDGAAG